MPNREVIAREAKQVKASGQGERWELFRVIF